MTILKEFSEKKWFKKAFLCCIIAISFALPSLITSQYYLRIVITIYIYAVLALSYNLILGIAGLLTLGHAAFFGIGAYTTALLMTHFSFPFCWLFSLVASVVTAGIFSFLIGLPSVRLRGDFVIMVTLAFNEIFRIIMLAWKPVSGGYQGITGIPYPTVFSFVFRTYTHYYFIILPILLVTYFTLRGLTRSKFGRALVSIREDELAASVMGVNVFHYRLLAFTLGSMYAGAAGSFYAMFFHFVSSQTFGSAESFLIAVMVIIGGPGNLIGSILGAAFLTVISEGLVELESIRLFVYGFLIIIAIMWRMGSLKHLYQSLIEKQT